MKSSARIFSLVICIALFTVMLSGCRGNRNKASGSDINVEQTQTSRGPATDSDVPDNLFSDEDGGDNR